MNKGRVVPVLILGLTAISFASIFIKLCTAPALVIAFYRLSLAAAFYWGLARIKNRPVWRSLDAKQKRLAVLSGLFLAAHFAFWITSLKYTSVASSVVLVQSAPAFVVIGGRLFLKERPTLSMLIGITVALAGAIVIGAADFRAEHSSLIGNILAMSGALAIILALIILEERLTLVKIFGGGVIIAGFCAVLISETREYNDN